MTGEPPRDPAPHTTTVPPPAVAAFLDGTDLDSKVGAAIGVVTTEPDGWPHPAQLSPGEILLSPDGEVRLAVRAHSAMADNLRRDGRVALMVAADGANNELRFQVTERAPLDDNPPRTIFAGRLVSVRPHRVPYADVVESVRYTLHDPDGTLQRWRRQIDALRSLDTSGQPSAT